MKKLFLYSCIVTIILMKPLAAEGKVIEVPLTDAVSIVSPDGGYRILLSFDIPDEVINSDLDYVRLILGRKKIQDEISLRLYCVTTSWEASTVSWDYPWERAGGDFTEYPIGTVHLYQEYFDMGKAYFFDVTEHVREILEVGDNFGFIVLPNDEEITGFGSDVLSLFDDPTVITVKYFISGD